MISFCCCYLWWFNFNKNRPALTKCGFAGFTHLKEYYVEYWAMQGCSPLSKWYLISTTTHNSAVRSACQEGLYRGEDTRDSNSWPFARRQSFEPLSHWIDLSYSLSLTLSCSKQVQMKIKYQKYHSSISSIIFLNNSS